MSPKKQKTNTNYFPDSNSTENDVDPLVTDSEVTNSLRQELREAINTMGPDTPQYFSEKISEIGSLDLENLQKSNATYNVVECKPAQAELKELYKNNLGPATDESLQSDATEVNIENVETSKSYSENAPIIICPKDNLAEDKTTKGKIMNRCHCLNENFVTIRRDPAPQQNRRSSRLDRHSITKWFKNRGSFTKKGNGNGKEPPEFYKMCVTEADDDHSPPRKLVFNLIDELPKPKCATIGVNTRPHICQSKEDKERKNSKEKAYIEDEKDLEDCNMTNQRNQAIHHKIKGCRCGIPARVDVYYFDHGNASYLRTTDNPPLIRSEIVADQSEECNIKFWGEIFGTVHIGTSFVTSFILQFFRFLLHSILRPLTIGLLQITSDYFFKPCLATFFNAIIQPPLICCYNVATSLRDICDPIAEGLGYFIREISILFRSCRLIDVRTSKPCDHARMQNNC